MFDLNRFRKAAFTWVQLSSAWRCWSWLNRHIQYRRHLRRGRSIPRLIQVRLLVQ